MLATMIFAAATASAPLSPSFEQWAARPTRAQAKAAYPADAVKAQIEGRATLLCTVASGGQLNDCAVQNETPGGAGFGAALLSLAPAYRLKPSVAKPGQTVLLNNGFDAGDLVDTPPDWIKRPTAGDLNAAFPRRAIEQGLRGDAVIRCTVTIAGALEQCVVSREQPAGLGFGAAALLLAPAFRMKPALQNGKPVSTSISIPIAFATPPTPAQPTGTRIANSGEPGRIFLDPPFDRVPSYAQVLAAWPKGAPATMTDGKAAMRCRLRETGLIDNCGFTFVSSTALERPSRELAKLFHVRLAPDVTREGLTGVYVAVAIQFLSPARADPERQITHAAWTASPDAERVAKVYPAAALSQNIKRGRATVDCRVTEDGGLSGCRSATEAPTGLGFGPAAVEIASMMKMNLWGEDGLPTAGASIRLPLQIIAPDAEGAAK